MEAQPLYEVMTRENLITSSKKGLPTHNDLLELAKMNKKSGGMIAILDDSLSILEGDDLACLFSQTIHHCNLSVLLVLVFFKVFTKNLLKV